MRKISVVIANRHQTSISLEEEFYEELLRIAHKQNQSLNQLITQIDAQKQIPNLSSAIRVYILNELKQQNNQP